MSVLNLALSNCALAREPMDDEFEKNMKKCNSMKSVRKLIDKDNVAMNVAEGDDDIVIVADVVDVTVDFAPDVTIVDNVAAATYDDAASSVTGAAWLITFLILCIISLNIFLCP